MAKPAKPRGRDRMAAALGVAAVLVALGVAWVLAAHALDRAMAHPAAPTVATQPAYTAAPAAGKGKAAATTPASGLLSGLLGHGGHGGAFWWLRQGRGNRQNNDRNP